MAKTVMWQVTHIKLPCGVTKYVLPGGEVKYLKNDVMHREDGPAHITPSGKQKWYYMGKIHRLDGPAFIAANGDYCYFVDGKEVTNEFIEWIKENNITYPFSKEAEVLITLRWFGHLFG